MSVPPSPISTSNRRITNDFGIRCTAIFPYGAGDPIQYEDPPRDLLKDDLFPPDSYSATTYWADLPFRERIKWVNDKSNAEARRELALLGASFKADPLQPIRDYFSKYVIVGMGLFVEGYTLFSVGNLSSLLSASARPTRCL